MNSYQIEKMRQLQAEKDSKGFNIADNILDVPEPRTVTESQSLRILLNQLIPPSEIVKKQKACLNAVIFKEFNFGLDFDEDAIIALCKEHNYELFYLNFVEDKGYRAIIKIPNYEYIDRALDKLYKLLGEYAPEKHQIQRPLADMSEDELDEIINKSQMAKLAERQATIIEHKPSE